MIFYYFLNEFYSAFDIQNDVLKGCRYILRENGIFSNINFRENSRCSFTLVQVDGTENVYNKQRTSFQKREMYILFTVQKNHDFFLYIFYCIKTMISHRCTYLPALSTPHYRCHTAGTLMTRAIICSSKSLIC